MAKEVNASQKKVRENALLLKHLISSLDESEKKLEEFYEKKEPENFNKTKKFILNVIDKISDITK